MIFVYIEKLLILQTINPFSYNKLLQELYLNKTNILYTYNRLEFK